MSFKEYYYIPNAISTEQENELIALIDKQQWENTYQRRTQQYGYFYDYKKRSVRKISNDILQWVLLPSILKPSILSDPISWTPTQAIINEYYAGQGINAHIDANCFGPIVMSLSLGADTIMVFEKNRVQIPFKLERRSLLVLTGDTRYNWSHSIPKHVGDRRISVTYRTLA